MLPRCQNPSYWSLCFSFTLSSHLKFLGKYLYILYIFYDFTVILFFFLKNLSLISGCVNNTTNAHYLVSFCMQEQFSNSRFSFLDGHYVDVIMGERMALYSGDTNKMCDLVFSILETLLACRFIWESEIAGVANWLVPENKPITWALPNMDQGDKVVAHCVLPASHSGFILNMTLPLAIQQSADDLRKATRKAHMLGLLHLQGWSSGLGLAQHHHLQPSDENYHSTSPSCCNYDFQTKLIASLKNNYGFQTLLPLELLSCLCLTCRMFQLKNPV